MAIRDDFTAGEVLAAADLNDTFASKPPFAYGTATPTTTVEGFIWYDEGDTPPTAYFWDGTEFQPFNSGVGNADFSDAATGTYTDSGIDYKYITYNSSGTLTCTVAGLADVLVIGGGGGGGVGSAASNGAAGGGGAGAAINTAYLLNPGTYSVTIGAGGASVTNGNASALGAIACTVGGGRGASYNAGNLFTFYAGGCGGGANGSTATSHPGGVTTMTSDFGKNGGAGGLSASAPSGGGGGGTSTAGVNAVTVVAGNGGAGISSSITGSAANYGGGGGGSRWDGTGTNGTGGAGGGGAGVNNAAGTAGTANTGGGGGGGSSAGGGNGGSGVVIIRVRTN